MATKVGKILELFVSKKEQSSRVNMDKISLDLKGVVEDKYYNKNIDRSVLITSMSSYELAKQNGIENMLFGSLGENILIDYDLYYLKVGDIVKIGDTVLEISQNCTLCNSLAKVNEKLPEILKEHRGIFAKVINGGSVKKGDIVHIG